MMAIDNITEKCLKVLDPNMETMTLEQKLRKIGVTLNHISVLVCVHVLYILIILLKLLMF